MSKELEFKTAFISICGTYRYWLKRIWDQGPVLVWVMLNPSTADAEKDDPTIRRVRSFTKREGYSGFVVVNVWALRATDPKDLHERREAFEEQNINCVQMQVSDRDVVVAWGSRIAHGPALHHIYIALQKAKSIRCLGITKTGEPRHPLMLKKDTPLVEFQL